MTDKAMIRELRAEVRRLNVELNQVRLANRINARRLSEVKQERDHAFNEGVAACAQAMEPHRRDMLFRSRAANLCWAQQRDPGGR